MTVRSYNGWVAAEQRSAIGVIPFKVAGVDFPGGVRSGTVHAVLSYVMKRYHEEVEPLSPGWCWGFAYRQNRNSDNLSCHASGTAVDANAPLHPNGKAGTFTRLQVRKIRLILAAVDDVVKWGGDFRGTPDEMHFEISGTPAEVAAVAKKLAQPSPTEEDDDMKDDERKALFEVRDLLRALVRPRRGDKADHDTGAVDLGDVLTKIEEETK